MLSSQRALFDLPRDVCYLNAASYSPLPLRTLEAGRAAVARKGRPWLLDNEFAAQQYDRVRKAAAALINAAPVDDARGGGRLHCRNRAPAARRRLDGSGIDRNRAARRGADRDRFDFLCALV